MTGGVGEGDLEYPIMELRNGMNELAGRGEANISSSMILRLTETTFNGMNELAGRGEANISASMMLRLTETTFTSPTSSCCRSATKDHRS